MLQFLLDSLGLGFAPSQITFILHMASSSGCCETGFIFRPSTGFRWGGVDFGGFEVLATTVIFEDASGDVQRT